jgi:energy-coupling factor transporter ATP-binding protein EcfA2
MWSSPVGGMSTSESGRSSASSRSHGNYSTANRHRCGSERLTAREQVGSSLVIERVDIENLKSFSGRHEVELAPLTIIFGPNSSGKSTFLQSLAVLKQTIEPLRSRIDLEEPPIGLHGELVDLGSFAASVNGHDLKKPIAIGISFTDEQDLPRKRVLKGLSLYAGLEFRYDEKRDAPTAAASTLGDDTRRVTFIPKPTAKSSPLAAFGNASFRLERSTADALLSLVRGRAETLEQGDTDKSRTDAETWTWVSENLVERLKEPKPLLFFGNGLFPTYPEPEIAVRGAPPTIAAFQMFDELWGMRERALMDVLVGLAYLGPLRAAPKRFELLSNELPTNVGPEGQDTSVLLARDDDLCDEVNSWLARLGIGYQLSVKRVKSRELDVELGDLLVTTLTDSRSKLKVTPQDVGFGISQLLPVIVQALVGTQRTICIEQPEIHIHPRLQAEVADLLIDSVKPRRGNQVIVETHSEHLMLRLQRRLRERNPEWLTADQIAVLYVDPDAAGGAHVTRLRLDDDGYFQDAWPSGFFAERLGELMSK